MTVRIGGRWARSLRIGALFVPLALLFAPTLYYSLDSPFSLVDDYRLWRHLRIFESSSSFLAWLDRAVGMNEMGCWKPSDEVQVPGACTRYRPAWQIYHAVVWKALGPNASALHLIRWILHFGAVAFFCAAFCRFCVARGGERHGAAGCLLPLALMVYVWVFFPNVPAVRLGPQEPLTVFFLGLCNYVAAVALSWESREEPQRRGLPAGQHPRARWRWLYGLFLLGILGLTFTKEINFALSLGLVAAYFVFVLLIRNARWGAGLAGVPLVGAVTVIVMRLSAIVESAGVGYGNAFSVHTSMVNAKKMLLGLFQVQTSVVVAAGFVLLLGALALGRVAVGLRPLWRTLNAGDPHPQKRQGAVDYELAFVLLLAVQFIGMFGILAASWDAVLRYWYPLVPLLSMLLAFAAKFVVEVGRRAGWPMWRVGLPLVAFVVFYVACNYYNFASQALAFHSLSNAEDEVVEEVRALGDRGEHVVVDARDELECSLRHRVGRFLAFFNGMDFTVHVEPPKNGRPYYFVTREELPHQEKATAIIGRRDYQLLAAASAISGALQLRREPFLALDASAGRVRMGRPYVPYVWNIYRMPADAALPKTRSADSPPESCTGYANPAEQQAYQDLDKVTPAWRGLPSWVKPRAA